MLNLSELRLIKPNHFVDLRKTPTLNSVVEVIRVFTEPMTTKQICAASGYSAPVVQLILRLMRYYGDSTIIKRGHIKQDNVPTGSTRLLDEHNFKAIPTSNTGVTGVSWVESTKTFHCCFGRKISITTNNLFDAVCMRKSLELSSI